MRPRDANILRIESAGDVFKNAQLVAQLAALIDPESAAQILGMALELDPEQVLRDGHAAYAHGDRTPLVEALNRAYIRRRVARGRTYKRLRGAA